jgi:hypothetical protein
MIFISQKYKNRNDIVKLSVEKDCELSCIESNNIVIMATYRSPSGCFINFLNILESAINKISHNNNKYIVICGDFNIDFNTSSNEKDKVLDLMNSFMLKQCIFQATRVTPSSATCIDNVFTDLTALSSQLTDFIRSDHCGQIVQLNINSVIDCQSNSCQYVTKRCTNSNNLENFLQAVASNCNNILLNTEDSDPNVSYDKFFKNIVLELDHHMPIKKVKTNKKKSF